MKLHFKDVHQMIEMETNEELTIASGDIRIKIFLSRCQETHVSVQTDASSSETKTDLIVIEDESQITRSKHSHWFTTTARLRSNGGWWRRRESNPMGEVS